MHAASYFSLTKHFIRYYNSTQALRKREIMLRSLIQLPPRHGEASAESSGFFFKTIFGGVMNGCLYEIRRELADPRAVAARGRSTISSATGCQLPGSPGVNKLSIYCLKNTLCWDHGPCSVFFVFSFVNTQVSELLQCY